MIRTLVINLERSPDRRDAIARRLGELKIPFEWFAATDGSRLTEAELALYSPRAAFAQLGREMHRNEIGCIMSHIRVWQELVDRGDEYVMVVEDDMLIDDDFPALVESPDWIPADAQVVNFAWDMATPIDLRPVASGRYLCRFDKDVMRTGSYILRRNGAEALLRNAFPVRMPVDSLMGDQRNIGSIYGITPRPVAWNDSMPSATWTDASMESFSNDSRRSARGLLFRVLNRLTG
jgi:glycosyl transferase family 25